MDKHDISMIVMPYALPCFGVGSRPFLILSCLKHIHGVDGEDMTFVG